MSLKTSARENSDIYTSIGLTAVIFFFVANAYLAYWNIHTISADTTRVTRTHEAILSLQEVLSTIKDAETGQRGYVITGDDKYLAPYNNALTHIDEVFDRVDRATQDIGDIQSKISLIRKHTDAKLVELKETVELRRTKGFQPAYEMVITDRGKNEMDSIRSLISDLESKETEIRQQQLVEMRGAYSTATFSGMLAGGVGILLSTAIAFLIRRTAIARKRQEWLQTGQVSLANATFGELHMQQLGDNILKFLAEYFGAQAGAFFVKNGNIFEQAATYGVPKEGQIIKTFTADDGLIGQAIKDNRAIIVSDVPDNYLSFGSSLGRGKPRYLLIAPMTAENHVNSVIELGFLQPASPLALELLSKISELVGVAVRSVSYRASLQDFLEETQRQSEELQAQSEELKVSNEELEEQSRVLKESQARLEQQQVEMEQTNSQLEEQTQMLELQRDDIERARVMVQRKAHELEQASQYKSNFLANMSHELRTPLNSSLILAKLLADNPQGNLTAEQVRFAQTIQSSGNDLLTLINDILDLSKIEAGHMEIRPENMQLIRMTKDLGRMFEPMAKQKSITFEVAVASDCPEVITSDRIRLEQVLKNLISNALKFTEKGSVKLSIRRAEEGFIAFAVSDTGIGISKEQQSLIFDAFRQADGTISRKYGGTGLGLSISRELTRLLGGHIELTSEAGHGSVFTAFIPEVYNAEKVKKNTSTDETYAPEPVTSSASKPATTPKHTQHIMDDRDQLSMKGRTILVIEDDLPFARILYDLAHENNFQCLVAHTAEDGLITAKQYLPHAVLLDVGLPDNSGLVVLDRLKQDTRTRHIPVHVISAHDYSQTAYSLGAVKYMMKPVKREELSNALKQVEERFSQRMRHVLIVEDDKVQRESLKKLLGAYDIKAVAVGTAKACLEQLKKGTFDCMVLDLSLPDATGYALLETLSKEEGYAFPPVIVYTGHDLTADQEQRLRRYSRSIIIKGAKSPERLLDEVTLFLHQVVSDMPPEKQRMLEKAKSREAVLEGRNILIVEDDVRNIYAVTSILEPHGAKVHIARNGVEALKVLEQHKEDPLNAIDLVLMDVMMPEMDGMTATRHIRKNPKWNKLPVIMLTAKAMKDDQERCLEAGANDYMAKPLDVEKLLSLVRVWIPR
jgi:CheY-like chemotaxis protein/signal transduction histidine kinase/CHASE3 domain sensor protein